MGRRRFSLRAKWTAALFAVGPLPLALFGSASLAIQRRGLEDAERQLEVAVIDHVASLLDGVADDAMEATRRVGRVLTDARVASEDAKLDLARDAMARVDVLAQVAIYSAKGELIDAIGRGDAPAPPPPPHAPSAVDPSGAWLPIEYGARGPVVRYAEAVLRDGAPRAWLVATLDASTIGARLEGISRDRFDAHGDGVLLLDGDGRVLFGAGTGLTPGASLAGRDVLAGQKLGADPFSRPFGMATEFTADGEAMVGSLRSLPARRWAVAVRRRRAAAYGALERARTTLLASTALFALAAIALGSYLGARATRPVRELVDLTRAYARRAFERRSTVRSGDELEELGASMTTMADDLAKSEHEITRRAAVEASLSRFLPGDVAKAIAEGRQALALGGERRAVSVLFADVVAFTRFAERAPPERVVALLNELFAVLTEVVFRHGGTVDKFMGDCVMALFGAPEPMADHAAKALAAAEDMHRFVEASAPAWLATYGAEVKLGIGVSSGEALVGNLGSEARMEYTAIGDVVNVASRLEGLARPGQTLVTSEVLKNAGEDFGARSLGPQPLRGKREPVEVFELR
jgi:class 3 adenylate cyclase